SLPSSPRSDQCVASRELKRNSANENRKTEIPNMLKGCGRAVPAVYSALQRTRKTIHPPHGSGLYPQMKEAAHLGGLCIVAVSSLYLFEGCIEEGQAVRRAPAA